MKAKVKQVRRMGHLSGEVPCVYRRDTIYNMCVMINALVDAVNYLQDELEELRKENETEREDHETATVLTPRYLAQRLGK